MYLDYKAMEKQNKRKGVFSGGTIFGRFTGTEKKRREPLK